MDVKDDFQLPPDAVKFASKMGIDLSGLEPEAEDIWKMLETMARNEPFQYQQFVKAQLENGIDNKETSSSKKTLRPSAGFCVETFTTDDLKVRELTSALKVKTLFINICSSGAIEPPTTRDGSIVINTMHHISADGLSVPLIIGPPREVTQKGNNVLAVDVIFNPVVVDLSLQNGQFKKQIVELAMDWLHQESSLRFDRSWKKVDYASYVGGRGKDSSAPVLFFVEDEQQRTDEPQNPLKNTSALLSSLAGQSPVSGPGDAELTLPSSIAVAQKGHLIEEVGAVGPAVSPPARPQSVSSVAAPAAPMSSAVVEEELCETSCPSVPASTAEYRHMERLMQRIDEDFCDSKSTSRAQDEDVSRQVLQDLGVMLSATGLHPTIDVKQQSNAAVPVSIRLRLQVPPSSAATASSSLESENQAVLTLHGLLSSLDPSLIDVQVSPGEVVVVVPVRFLSGGDILDTIPTTTAATAAAWGMLSATLLGDACFDKRNVVASFKKKKGELVVKVGLLSPARMFGAL